MDDVAIERAAVGRFASLGDLYDAQRDMFCNLSILATKIPKDAISTLDCQYSEINLVHSDSTEEKFSKMKISADMQVSLLTGLVSTQGSGGYLTERKTSEKAVKCSLVYSITTVDEFMNVNNDTLEKSISLSALEGTSATHMVTGIIWGANCILSYVHQNKERMDTSEINGKLNLDLSKVKKALFGDSKALAQNNTNAISTECNYEISIFGDILPKDSPLPTTVAGAIDLLQRLPTLLNNCNSGKGIPLRYRLLPLSYIRHKLNRSLNIENKLQTIENAILHRIVQCFERISLSTQRLNDIFEDITKFKCATQHDISDIFNLKRQVEIDEHNLRGTISAVIIDVRSCRSDVSDLAAILDKFESNSTYPEKLPDILPSWNEITENISFVRTLVQHGVRYVGTDTSLDAELLKHLDETAYVLYYNNSQFKQNPQIWSQTKHLFFLELKNKNLFQKYYAVNCDLHSNLANVIEDWCCIKTLRQGKVLVENLLEDQQKIQDIPFVQATSYPNQLAQKPNTRTAFSTPCCGKNCNPSYVYDWTCKKCQQLLEYGFDQNVYCICGQTHIDCLEFKCTDESHGVGYQKPDLENLVHHLKALRPFKELNILILGETGVGKSTWINGFANFLRYESLKDAEDGELCSPIPSQFTVCNDRFEEIAVTTGTDSNEVHQPGQSATQLTKVYPFPIGDSIIRLIDTPGIGDTRGVEHDETNFENIMGVLSHLDEIHGICILLKPNNARLNVMFRFCIKELLANLHREASKNILFCFTNSRGTFYRPGDTMPALRKLLSENNDVEIAVSYDTVYCFDSEAYRFLAAIKNQPPVKFRDDERANFVNSWEKSVAETHRMIQHIIGLEPHQIKGTISLHHARELVVKLSRPLAEISRTIEINRAIVEEEKKKIQETHASIEDLRNRLTTTRMAIDVRPLGHAQTVCAHEQCVKKITVNGTEIVEYVTVCHDRCGLGVGSDSIGSMKLLLCRAMKLGNCKICGHSFRQHHHIFYKSVQVLTQVDDPEVSKLLNKNLSAADIKQELLDIKDKQLKEYEDELAEIEKASVKFAYFLKINAITPYNDARKQYLEHFIREERDKVSQGGNPSTLQKLQKNLDSYLQQIELLEKSMAAVGSTLAPPQPEDVSMMVKNLQKLKHSGKSLLKSLECVEKTQNATYTETVVSPLQDIQVENNLNYTSGVKKNLRKTLFQLLTRRKKQ